MQEALARIGSALRLNRGGRIARRVAGGGARPKPKLVLYEYENSPWCKRVREVLTFLALDHEVRPCPRSSLFRHLGPPLQAEGHAGRESRFRLEAKETYGARIQYPVLVDETAGAQLQDSADIVQHLWAAYGGDVVAEDRPGDSLYLAPSPSFGSLQAGVVVPPLGGASRLLDVPTLAASTMLHAYSPAAGIMMTPSKAPPEEEIVLVGHEACPRTRTVREALCTLQLPYRMVVSTDGPLPRLTIGDEDVAPPGSSASMSEKLFERFAVGSTVGYFGQHG